MSDDRNPYSSLPESSFWKTAVAEVPYRQIDLEWKPKAPITRATRIITAGSCFAQHISRSLRKNGFNWLDSEPAPVDLPPVKHAEHGYGVFSFRTGNIYTAASLKQWVEWATGKDEQSTKCFLEDGRVFDPFRPSLFAEGFPSAEAMLAERQATLAAMLEGFGKADLFIFTLGLTEAWGHRGGPVYPICPGTIRGTFSPGEHVFHNYSEQEVVRDLNETFDELRRVNPDLRFLLTVSPVALTATASGQHVLTATTYSKAVLRSAAGLLAQARADTDYFPSYELIAAPAFKGHFFERNLRTVSPEGVSFVMGQFFRAIGADATPVALEVAASAMPVPPGISGKAEPETDVCDEIILETWSNKPVGDSQAPPGILLVGDSHMGMLAKALDEQQVRYVGGAIMNRSEWHELRFDLDREMCFRPHDEVQRGRWEEAYRAVLANRENSLDKPLIITNVGIQTTLAIADGGIFRYLERIYDGKRPDTVKLADLQTYLLISRRNHLALLCKFLAKGRSVIVVTDPPTEPYLTELFVATEAILSDLYRSVGCTVFCARDWIKGLGGMPAEFRSTEVFEVTGLVDWLHGSLEYYRRLAREILVQA